MVLNFWVFCNQHWVPIWYLCCKVEQNYVFIETHRKKKRQKCSQFCFVLTLGNLNLKAFAGWISISLFFCLAMYILYCTMQALITRFRWRLGSYFRYYKISQQYLIQNEFMRSSFLPKCPGSLLEGRAEILVIFGWHFVRNDGLTNSFWI